MALLHSRSVGCAHEVYDVFSVSEKKHFLCPYSVSIDAKGAMLYAIPLSVISPTTLSKLGSATRVC